MSEPLETEDFFMHLCSLAAKRSNDPVTRVGSVIVNEDNIIVGVGHNEMPKNSNKFSWEKDNPNPLENKGPYVCHAELNAIVNKNAANLKNCRIYVSMFPCNECAKLIIQLGITEVIYYSDKRANKDYTKASKRMFRETGVKVRQFSPKNEKISIDCDEINGDKSRKRRRPDESDS
ncbi:unnamed protein product [Phyllotreta striolata]|uniref:Probable deoxycytidylate deaminase n=1 Tax=Phyllotreta striolata TaxID=444603 RepID=A0A9N9TRM3_PHYSR|nr:unnamed protein product [Phyllotreta striolata]